MTEFAVPSPRQLEWHERELYAFVHFGINTFTGREWGFGDEDPNLFNPNDFDADAIVSELADAGMTAVVLTAKHHDGFCLWPTETTEHNISASSWRGGAGDLVRDMSQAAARHRIGFGVYLSPWDRNNAAYGTNEYIDIYRRQLRELLINYGPIVEVWFDGANGGDGYYGGANESRQIDNATYYRWEQTWQLVRELQPNAVIFSDVGPDVRWVGNEDGTAGDPCWATFEPVGERGAPAAPGSVDTTNSAHGTPGAPLWMPAECDVSIRPGWFWRASEDPLVKTPDALLELYLASVGRGAALHLNVPPTTSGRLSPVDVVALREFKRLREPMAAPTSEGAVFHSDDTGAVVTFAQSRSFTVVDVREQIRDGQRIRAAAIEIETDAGWQHIARVTSIGSRCLIRLDREYEARGVRVVVEDAVASPLIASLAVH